MVLNLRLHCVDISMKIQLVQIRFIVRNDTCMTSLLQVLGACYRTRSRFRYLRVPVHVRLQDRQFGKITRTITVYDTIRF